MQIQRREAESAFTGKGSETEPSGLFVLFEVGKSLRFCFSSLSCGSKLVAFVFLWIFRILAFYFCRFLLLMRLSGFLFTLYRIHRNAGDVYICVRNWTGDKMVLFLPFLWRYSCCVHIHALLVNEASNFQHVMVPAASSWQLYPIAQLFSHMLAPSWYIHILDRCSSALFSESDSPWQVKQLFCYH